MDKEAIKEFILKNSSDSKFYGLFYKEKQLLKQNDLMGFAQYQLKKNKNMFIGSFSIVPLVLSQLLIQFPEYLETGELLPLIFCISMLLISYGVIFRSTKEYYSIKSSMTLLIAILEEEQNTQEEVSNSSAILSNA
ncbi:MAG: hypothetical protein ABJH08_04635 [Balneola sp.]